HPGGEVPPCGTDHDDRPAGHVFATVIADPFDDRAQPRIPDAEAFSRPAADEDLARGRPVTGDVPDDDVLFGDERRLFRREDADLAPRKPLAEIIVRVPFDLERHATRDERGKALTA